MEAYHRRSPIGVHPAPRSLHLVVHKVSNVAHPGLKCLILVLHRPKDSISGLSLSSIIHRHQHQHINMSTTPDPEKNDGAEVTSELSPRHQRLLDLQEEYGVRRKHFSKRPQKARRKYLANTSETRQPGTAQTTPETHTTGSPGAR